MNNMSDFLSCLDQLKSVFLDDSNDAATLLHLRTQLDEVEETTADGIKIGLITALKRIIINQQLHNSKHATDTWKHFMGKIQKSLQTKKHWNI